MKALAFRAHSSIENREILDLTQHELRAGWVRLRVLAVALNHLDIWIRRGWPGLQLPLPHVTGADICGEVVAVNSTGLAPDFGFQPGDRVVVYPGLIGDEDEYVKRGEPSVSPHYQVLGEHISGGLAEFVDLPLRNLVHVNKEDNVAELAAPNLVVTTVWRMLFIQGKAVPGEDVLIVGSGGGVNVLALQICIASGLRTFVLAGGAEKAEQARKLGAYKVIDYREEPNWHRTIHTLTSGRGVDLVVDNVGAATFQKSLKALRRGGRLVTVGNTSGFSIEIDNRLIFSHQLAIIGSTMGSMEDWKKGLSFLKEKGIRIPLDGVYPLSEGRLHLERMERGDHFGKIVLIP